METHHTEEVTGVYLPVPRIACATTGKKLRHNSGGLLVPETKHRP
jgi:hypothetical protein